MRPSELVALAFDWSVLIAVVALVALGWLEIFVKA